MVVKKQTNKMANIISNIHTHIYATDHVLARVWLILLCETNITKDKWFFLLDKWQQKMLRKSGTTKDASSLKGNVNSQLSKPVISWNYLMKGFDILGVVTVDFDIKFTFADKSVINVKVTKDISTEDILKNYNE